MLLPAALRYLKLVEDTGVAALGGPIRSQVERFVAAIDNLRDVNEEHPEGTEVEAVYMRDSVLTAMAEVRECADALERIVADDMWPLPKYAEILFVK